MILKQKFITIPLHKQKAARSHCKFNEKDLKNVEYQAKHLLTIPVHQFLCEEHMNIYQIKFINFMILNLNLMIYVNND